jgi:hypothetical protein
VKLSLKFPGSSPAIIINKTKAIKIGFSGILSDNFQETVNFMPKHSFMSLIPNKKNKKDNRPGGGGIGNLKPGQQNQKVKTNTKGLVRNTKLTGGSQRGS